MNVLLFTSYTMGFTYLESTFKELKQKNHQAFFLYGNTNNVINHPPSNLDKFNYDSTLPIDFSKGYFMESLGLNIPFVPDYLIIARDKWAPEQNIIHEFKTKYPNTKIAFIEVNTPLLPAIEIKLENISRTKHPQNQIDIIFQHSSHCAQISKNSLEWEGWDKIHIVGNPVGDNNPDIPLQELNKCYKKYNVDKTKIQLLFFGCINGARKEVFKRLKYISKNLDRSKYQLYFKPYPIEATHPHYRQDYNPFIIQGVDGIIWDQLDLNTMSYICDYHIGILSSVNYKGLLYKKQQVEVYPECSEDVYLNLYLYLNDNKFNGSDNYSSKFWMRIHDLKTQQEFIELIGEDNLKQWLTDTNKFKNIKRKYCHDFNFNMDFLTSPKKDSHKLLKYYDNFNDGKSSKRIVEYLETNVVNQ
jgi:hypothetical protein